MDAVRDTLVAALSEHSDAVVWPRTIAEHLTIALKCVLCSRAGLPDLVHRAFARTQGVAFFGWFCDWIDELAEDPQSFVAGFLQLPSALRGRTDELVAVAASTISGPASINFALASRQERVIVLPDHWDDTLQERTARRWSRVSPDLIRESDWRGRRHEDRPCLIAFGEIGRDRLVDDMLDKSERELEASEEGGEVLVTLKAPKRARNPWQLAIAVHDPEVAGNFSAENVMGLFHGTARFANYRFVEGDGMARSFLRA